MWALGEDWDAERVDWGRVRIRSGAEEFWKGLQGGDGAGWGGSAEETRRWTGTRTNSYVVIASTGSSHSKRSHP